MRNITVTRDQHFTPLLFAISEHSKKFIDSVRNSKIVHKFPKFRAKSLAILVVVLILVIAGIVWAKSRGGDNGVLDQNFVAEGPRLELNKKFNVPIRAKDGKETGQSLGINVTTLERTNRILFKGRPLVARSSKDFLVINLEVDNSTNNRLTVRPVDFFRLIDASGKSYAPDIQTDPVKVEPLSSKRTRTIYIVSEDQNNLKFLIGEIKGGSKETVEVTI